MNRMQQTARIVVAALQRGETNSSEELNRLIRSVYESLPEGGVKVEQVRAPEIAPVEVHEDDAPVEMQEPEQDEDDGETPASPPMGFREAIAQSRRHFGGDT